MKSQIVALFLSLVIPIKGFVTEYYFSSTGNDNSLGTMSSPWKTIQKLNSLTLDPGDKAFFKRGDTFPGTIIISGGGSPGNKVVISSYGTGSDPVITGGTNISSWTNLGGGIYESTLSIEPKVVTIGGVQYAPGRYPNMGWMTINATNGSNVTSTGLSTQSGLVGAKAVIRMNNYIIEKCPITSFSGTTIGVTANYTIQQGWGFFITNKLSTLDSYGEWFYEAGKLKMFFGAAGPSNVIASTNDYIIILENKSYFTFSGLDFRYANTTIAKLEDAQHITFDSCQFTFSGFFGIRVGGSNNQFLTISNCKMRWINSDGIKIYGNNNDGLVIRGNTISKIGMFRGEGGLNEYRGITLENEASINAEISFNCVDSVGYIPINGLASGATIKNNFVTNFCMFLDDGGGIYVQQSQGTNKRITGNIVIGGPTDAAAGTPFPNGATQVKGIYSDAGNANTEIDNNSVTGCDDGIYIGTSNNINLHHNTCFGNRINELSVDQAGYEVSPVTGMVFKNNILVGNTAINNVVSYQNHCNCGTAVSGWGVIDSNYYARPIFDTKTIYSYPVGAYYTLAEWKAFMPGYDQHTKKSPIPVFDPSKIRFEYNTMNTDKTVYLDAVYMGMDSTLYVGNTIIQPFRSKVFLWHSIALSISTDSLVIDPNKKRGIWVYEGKYYYNPYYSGKETVEIIDMMGRLVYREEKAFRLRLNVQPLPTLPNGLYLLRIGDKTVKFKK